MEHSLFISDLHLCESRPNIIKSFVTFLENTAIKASRLYILGDFFEYWAGDDAISVGVHNQSITALKKLSQSGVKIFFMHGNRDFLIGETFCTATGATLLPDPCPLTLYEHQIILSHGDALCTDDVDYQVFRKTVRDDAWQQNFLSQPLAMRMAKIEELRKKSQQAQSTKMLDIMDVNQSAVEQLLTEHAYPSIFIHGHTHRPDTHTHEMNGNQCKRWVLGDWYDQGSYLRLDATGCRTISL